ncbi:hypothetical protein HOY82DRAFT_604088 [Tuber indicum]|nr:hypothetical protein HOY82DRAFT_604088 [Tuber indicum]
MVTVGDIILAEVHDVLQKTADINSNVVQDISSLVGWQITVIKWITRDLKDGIPWEEIRAEVIINVKINFIEANLSQCGEFYELRRQISARILRDGHIGQQEFLATVGILDVALFLLSSNVLAILAKQGRCACNSKPTEHIARKICADLSA